MNLEVTTPMATAAGLVDDGAATVLHHGPMPWAMDDNLSGELCAEPKVCREVAYQWIISLGETEYGVDDDVEALDYAIKNITADGAGDKKIVYAFSGGARVASVWLEEHAEDADAPDADDLTFVLIGNGGRKYGGVNGWWYADTLLTPTDTQYSVIDVAREYDPIADFPDDPFNLLALANAFAAFYYVHMDYSEVDLDDGANYVWTEGNTTYVFVPTENLPLLQGLRDLGLDSLADVLEEPLREIIDGAYDREYLEGVEPQGEQSAADDSSDIAEIAPLSVEQDSVADDAVIEENTGDTAETIEVTSAAVSADSPDTPADTDSAETSVVDGTDEDTAEATESAEEVASIDGVAGTVRTTGKHRADRDVAEEEKQGTAEDAAETASAAESAEASNATSDDGS